MSSRICRCCAGCLTAISREVRHRRTQVCEVDAMGNRNTVNTSEQHKPYGNALATRVARIYRELQAVDDTITELAQLLDELVSAEPVPKPFFVTSSTGRRRIVRQPIRKGGSVDICCRSLAGHPGLVRGRRTLAAQGWPNLQRGHQTLEASGYAGLESGTRNPGVQRMASVTRRTEKAGSSGPPATRERMPKSCHTQLAQLTKSAHSSGSARVSPAVGRTPTDATSATMS